MMMMMVFDQPSHRTLLVNHWSRKLRNSREVRLSPVPLDGRAPAAECGCGGEAAVIR